jgi:hypothetical protein
MKWAKDKTGLRRVPSLWDFAKRNAESLARKGQQ